MCEEVPLVLRIGTETKTAGKGWRYVDCDERAWCRHREKGKGAAQVSAAPCKIKHRTIMRPHLLHRRRHTNKVRDTTHTPIFPTGSSGVCHAGAGFDSPTNCTVQYMPRPCRTSSQMGKPLPFVPFSHSPRARLCAGEKRDWKRGVEGKGK